MIEHPIEQEPTVHIPPDGRSDKIDAANTARLAEHTFTPGIARALRVELEALADLTWLAGRGQFLALCREVRDAHNAAVERELAATTDEETA